MRLNNALAVWSPVFAQIDLKNATLKIKDGGTNEMEVTLGEGNLVYTERQNVEYTLDRGTLDEVRLGDEVPVEVRMDAVWEYITSRAGGTPTIKDAIQRRGQAASWTSTDADACRPYAVDIEVTYEPVPGNCGDKEVITLSDFRWEQADQDLRAGTIAFSGRCNVTSPTVVRSAQSY